MTWIAEPFYSSGFGQGYAYPTCGLSFGNSRQSLTQFPDHIPDDIVRLILEELFLSEETSGSQKCRMLLIANHVRLWLEPLLYRVLDFTGDIMTWYQFKPLLPIKAPLLHIHVQSIFIESDFPDYRLLFECCPNIYELVLGRAAHIDDLASMFSVEMPHLRRLRLHIVMGGPDGGGSPTPVLTLRRPLLRHLTHLCMTIKSPPDIQIEEVESIPDLSHLYIHLSRADVGLSSEWRRSIANQLQDTLKIFVLQTVGSDQDLLTQLYEETDPRIVFVIRRALGELKDFCLQRGWQSTDAVCSKDYEPDLWELAADIVKRRLAVMEAMEVESSSDGFDSQISSNYTSRATSPSLYSSASSSTEMETDSDTEGEMETDWNVDWNDW